MRSQYSTPVEKSATSPVRMYSEVVRNAGSRNVSPEYPVGKETTEAVKAGDVRNDISSPSSESEVEGEGDDPESWTRVVRKKSRDRRTRNKLRPEQERVVREAEKQLTPDERERIRRRSLSRNADTERNDSPAGNGNNEPRASKGKGTDPRNST